MCYLVGICLTRFRPVVSTCGRSRDACGLWVGELGPVRFASADRVWLTTLLHRLPAMSYATSWGRP